MKITMLRFALPAFCLAAVQLQGQQAAPAPAAPTFSQSLIYVDVNPGKAEDWKQFLRDSTMKVAQARADAGEIVSWTLLRAVMPAGKEARSDYAISVISAGAPREPMSREVFETWLKKSGSTVSPKDFYEKRASMTTLVTSELWRVEQRVGAPKKGHYIFINSMKVHDEDAYGEFESGVWRPLAEAFVKQGGMSGWIYATKLLPSGSETEYSAFSADMFPTWEAVWADRNFDATFAKVHPGVSLEEIMTQMPKLRSLAKRELWIIDERVEKNR